MAGGAELAGVALPLGLPRNWPNEPRSNRTDSPPPAQVRDAASVVRQSKSARLLSRESETPSFLIHVPAGRSLDRPGRAGATALSRCRNGQESLCHPGSGLPLLEDTFLDEPPGMWCKTSLQ